MVDMEAAMKELDRLTGLFTNDASLEKLTWWRQTQRSLREAAERHQQHLSDAIQSDDNREFCDLLHHVSLSESLHEEQQLRAEPRVSELQAAENEVVSLKQSVDDMERTIQKLQEEFRYPCLRSLLLRAISPVQGWNANAAV